MEINTYTRKDIGALGEKVAEEYLKRHGFEFIDRNVVRKTGEIDLIMKKNNVLHFVEVKSVLCNEFPRTNVVNDRYDPSINLHRFKIQIVVRTSEWYMANIRWEGESQVDGALVWLHAQDRVGRVQYLPQIL